VPTVGSLFSGIGGFDLGLERAGFEIKWQVELDEYARRVLAKHWPNVSRYSDIRSVDFATVEPVDVLCGGFPCQDLSFAGKRAGIDGERSGLWAEYVRAIRTLRPRFVLVENVPGLLTNAYLGRVLGDLASCGFNAQWDCLPASAFSAPHRRDRVWIVAYPDSDGQPNRNFITRRVREENTPQLWLSRRTTPLRSWLTDQCGLSNNVDGLSEQVDSIRALGNAIVPQIAEALGRMILTSMEASHAENVLGRENVSASQSVRRKDTR
jgi:DNA (cytosine-5)-methyltransferase 1